MSDESDRELVEKILKRNRYLVLSTTDGTAPWIAPLEYIIDDNLNFYFFSVENSRHAQDLERTDKVAVAVFDREQGEYSPEASVVLNGVQLEATARKVSAGEYTDAIVSAINALNPPMPPYAVFKIEPKRFYVPKIENGLNIRVEVNMSH